MSYMPNDPVMLLSVINTKLRDVYPTLEKLCQEEDILETEVIAKLAAIDYIYDEKSNQFK